MTALADAVFSHMFAWLAPPRDRDGTGDRAARPRVAAETVSKEPDDPATVEGLRAGDATVYDRVFREHYPMLVGFATSFLGDRARAEEIVGNVFVWLYEHRTTLTVSGSLRGYLCVAVRHAALNARRGRDRELRRYDRIREADVEGVVPAAMPLPDETLLVAESSEIVRNAIARALERLPDHARLVLALRLHRGLSYEDIARALGVSQAAAKQRFSRAIAALRVLLPDLLE